jgi:hypothetical protein
MSTGTCAGQRDEIASTNARSDKKRLSRTYQPIELAFDGKMHHGRFYVERGWLTLSTNFGSKSAALNGSPPPVLAQILFRDLIADATRS